ncbi:TetR/AcrR family transcriptional regulator [Neobacillus sp. PS3-34]|uniref:TetR/AcrR family transcriptional regulator n=1 Tax=Neobacillus sp. PS3-34 TaxID=3070678 RepID=UPI0027E02BE4|nr:TetR/AcrR family transcriptional regulator [Neobacillus sp. PS3-34]WML46621.1 TetR/AcrR family transcriptional regulator [Neobacillus sp. PS3-34]
MPEKEQLIIESGLKLFAHKGFSSTSIQEIATESGISKGAFYLHFKSKDDLLLAILKNIFDTIHSSTSFLEKQDLSPREMFIKQLSAFFGTFIGHKEFLIMLSKEQAIPRNDEIKELLFKKHFENHLFFRKELVSIYGEKIEPYSIDLAMMLEGLFHSYLRLWMFEPLDIDIEELAKFIMRRMDSIVKDISSESAFLTDQKLGNIIEKTKDLFENTSISSIVQKMRSEIDQLENKEALEISLEVLEEEINKQNPRIPVIKGMLSNFKDIKSLETYTGKIAAYYGFLI